MAKVAARSEFPKTIAQERQKDIFLATIRRIGTLANKDSLLKAGIEGGLIGSYRWGTLDGSHLEITPNDGHEYCAAYRNVNRFGDEELPPIIFGLGRPLIAHQILAHFKPGTEGPGYEFRSREEGGLYLEFAVPSETLSGFQTVVRPD